MKTTLCLTLVCILMVFVAAPSAEAAESDPKVKRDVIRVETDRDDIHSTPRDQETKATKPLEQTTPDPSTSSATGEEINWQVISSGGNTATSTSFSLSGTVGQTATGYSENPSFGLSHGFWQTSSAGCCMRRGDVDGNGRADVLDVDYFIEWLFRVGPAPGCIDEADVDGNGRGDVLDVDYFIEYLFRSGPDLVPCP